MSHTIDWTIATFAWDHMASETSLVNLIHEMGEKAARFTVLSTRIAYLLAKPGQGKSEKEFHTLVERAALVLQSKGFNAAEVKKGERRRTETEEKAYTAARVWWMRLLKSQNIETKEKRGGARVTKANDDKEAKPKASNAVTPTAKEPKDGRIFIRQQAAMLLAYSNKNATMLDLATRNAIEHFCNEVNSIKD